jgi:hypothetical protein
MWESCGTYVYAGFSLRVFFLGASSLLECVLYVSLLLCVCVWHTDPPDIIAQPVNNGTLMTKSPHQYAVTETV